MRSENNLFFLQNPKIKSISQGMFYCAHQEHRAVLKNIGPQYTQMQSFILTPLNVFVKIEMVFGLQMSYLLHF